jgi:ParB family transcriptional regulator, chromosome partitioning protein
MALGKSLGNILEDYFGEQSKTQLLEEDVLSPYTAKIPINEIEFNPWQTRTIFDQQKIQKLAEDIQINGLIQPILVIANLSQTSDKRFRLLAGERRLRACLYLNYTEILATVRPVGSLNAGQQAFISAMENLQREDLNPIDLGATYQMLLETQSLEPVVLAEKLGVTSQYIKNYIRLLTLDPEVKKALLEKKIGEGQARHLVGLEHEKQKEILKEIMSKDLTVKEIIHLLGKHKDIKVEIIKTENHKLPAEVISKITRIATDFPKAKIRFTGDIDKGKIVISWKKKIK